MWSPIKSIKTIVKALNKKPDEIIEKVAALVDGSGVNVSPTTIVMATSDSFAALCFLFDNDPHNYYTIIVDTLTNTVTVLVTHQCVPSKSVW